MNLSLFHWSHQLVLGRKRVRYMQSVVERIDERMLKGACNRDRRIKELLACSSDPLQQTSDFHAGRVRREGLF